MKQSQLKHVAIIMDGNGRWASSRLRPRVWGHVRGAQVVSDIVKKADDLGIQSLTLYAFSTENWSRPLEEVKILLKILKKFLLKEEKRIISNNIKFKVIGEINELSEELKNLISDLENKTQNATGLNLTFAFSYGGRTEIVDAVNTLIEKNEAVTEESLSKHMYRPECGDADLLIRTGGDVRISNFLLWQSAYAELFFTKTPWPLFTPYEFENIILEVNNRQRKFGSLKTTEDFNSSSSLALSNRQQFKKNAHHV